MIDSETLADITESQNFVELRHKTSIRLAQMQKGNALEGFYDGTWKDKSSLSKLIKEKL